MTTSSWNWAEHRVVVTGGAGFLGRVVCRMLEERGARHVEVPRKAEFDLTIEVEVERMYRQLEPDVVLHLAAEVGGIGANRVHPGRFFFANMAMGMHLIEHARRHGVRKFVQVGTACSYPKFAPLPFSEDNLWSGYPEETNAPYGVAKKSLFVMLDAYRREYGLPAAAVIPVNLYGPGDNFHPETSHVIPALIRKCAEAKQRGDEKIVCWGTGSASRGFLYVDDAAEGILAAAERMDDPTPINLGSGREVPIRELIERIVEITGFAGRIEWDDTKPDGQPRRSLDSTRAAELLDWRPRVSLEEGLRRTVEWFETQTELREVTYG